MSRRGLSLLEVMAAVIMLAVIGGPIITHMIMSKRSVESSSADVAAVIQAGKLLEKLGSVPYARLPVPAAGAASELTGAVSGIPRSRWRDGFPTDGGRFEDLVQLLGAVDPDGMTSYVWVRAVPLAEVGFSQVPVKEITVSVLYKGSGDKVSATRRYSLRGLSAEHTP